MSAFTIVSVLSCDLGPVGAGKSAVITATGPASYDTGGSVLDLSTASAVLVAASAAFAVVDGVDVVGSTAAASQTMVPMYVRAALGAPATGVLAIQNLAVDPVAQIGAATDLSGTTWIFRVYGR